MILKRIYEEYNFDVEVILIKEYKRLKLTQSELMVLLAFFSIHKKRKTFSVMALSRRLDFTQNEIAPLIEALMDKGFLNIEIEINNNREREIFNLDGTFNKIEQIFKEDEKAKIQALTQNNVMTAITLFEDNVQRVLRPQELERIRKWYEEDLYNHDNIINTINIKGNKATIANVEKNLSQENIKELKIDEKTDRILDAIYQKL